MNVKRVLTLSKFPNNLKNELKKTKSFSKILACLTVSTPILSYIKSGDSFEKISTSPNFETNLPDIDFPEDIDIMEFITNGEFTTKGVEELLDNFDFEFSDVIYGSSLILKAKEPINDIKKGDVGKGLTKGAIRAFETYALLPFKYGWAAIKGVKGVVLAAKGIESKESGFIGGAMSGLKGWVRERKIFEKELTEENFVAPDTLHDHMKTREKMDKVTNLIQGECKKIGDKNIQNFRAWKEGNLGVHASIANDFESIIKLEKERADFYAKQANKIKKNEKIDIQAIKKDLQKLKNEKKNINIFYNQVVQQMKKSATNASADERINKLVEKIKNAYLKKQTKLDKEIEKVNNLLFIHERFETNESKKGFSRLAGYSEIKNLLKEIYLSPLSLKFQGEKVNIPNSILFYGPKGCGKTLFSNAMEQESNSKVINMSLNLDNIQDIKSLNDAINTAKNNFLQGCSTIIKIEEADNFLINTSIPKELMAEINSLSDYNCTIIATTNYPENINKQLFENKNSKQIFIPTPNEKNIQLILEHCIKDFSDESIDLSKLTKKVLDNAGDNAYSNAKLVNSLKNGIKKIYVQKGKLNQHDFLEILSQTLPDVKKETINAYKMKG